MKSIRLIYVSSILVLLFSLSSYAHKNTYAVIIGVGDYEYINDVNVVVKGANHMKRFLLSEEGGSVPEENILYLTDKDASKWDIMYYSKKLFAKAQPGDRVIFYFTGHGKKGAFLPYDVNMNGDNLLYFDDVKEIFRTANCETKLLFGESCYSGSLKNTTGNRNSNSNEQRKNGSSSKTRKSKQNIAVMLSSSANEVSWVTSNSTYGALFTESLILGLSGYADRNDNDKITIKELFYFVHDRTIEESLDIGTKQTPVLFGNFNLNLIVARL